jgi:serine/threonine-protein phosphatase 2A regulatory subunit B'
MKKDASLTVPLLDGLLKYWPFANKEKEPLFLTELQEVLEFADVESIKDLAHPLFQRIA